MQTCSELFTKFCNSHDRFREQVMCYSTTKRWLTWPQRTT